MSLSAIDRDERDAALKRVADLEFLDRDYVECENCHGRFRGKIGMTDDGEQTCCDGCRAGDRVADLERLLKERDAARDAEREAIRKRWEEFKHGVEHHGAGSIYAGRAWDKMNRACARRGAGPDTSEEE